MSGSAPAVSSPASATALPPTAISVAGRIGLRRASRPSTGTTLHRAAFSPVPSSRPWARRPQRRTVRCRAPGSRSRRKWVRADRRRDHALRMRVAPATWREHDAALVGATRLRFAIHRPLTHRPLRPATCPRPLPSVLDAVLHRHVGGRPPGLARVSDGFSEATDPPGDLLRVTGWRDQGPLRDLHGPCWRGAVRRCRCMV